MRRRTGSRTVAVLRRAAGWCLQYPDENTLGALPVVRDAVHAVSHPAAEPLAEVLDYLNGSPPRELAEHYVRIFDTRPRRTLYLTWYVDGDTRRRGASLVRLKGIYREHGFTLPATELPDFLPVLLEFAARCGDERAGSRLLAEFRPSIALLADNLAKAGTPYLPAVRAALATVPPGKATAPAQPPAERVGLDPYPAPVPGASR